MTGRRGTAGRDTLAVVAGAEAEAAPGGAPGPGEAADTPLRRRLGPPVRPDGRHPRPDGQPGATGGAGGAFPVAGAPGPGAPATGRGPGAVRRKGADRPTIDLDELWAPVRRDRAVADREFLPGALEILEAPASPIRIALIYVLCGLVATALVWSWFGHLDVYADATGKVQASGRTKVVQPIESGKVVRIGAADGDAVKAGAVLIELDPTAAIADRTVVRDNLFSSRADVVRHGAEMAALTRGGVDVTPGASWPADLPPAVRERAESAMRSELSSLAATLANLEAQKAAKVAERDKFKANITPQTALIALINEHLGMRDQLYKSGWNSRATVLEQEQQLQTAQLQLANIQGSLAEAEAAIAVLTSQVALTRQTFVTTHTDALVAAQQKVDQLAQALAKADEKVAHMTLTAPIDGIVQATAVTTVGQVVTTGQQLMQVVPEGAPIEIDAYILNSDAGFVKVGQEATIKVDTFPYTRYGTLSGKVTKVAADALPGKQAQQQQQNASTPASADGALSATSSAQQTRDLVFPVTVVPEQKGLMVQGRLRPLTSGMTVTVEIKTESRRAIDYILSPLQSLFEEAGQER